MNPYQRHNDQNGSNHGPKGPPPNPRCSIVTNIKKIIKHQLKSLPTKMSIYDLLQISKAHRDSFMEVLNSI